MTIQTQGVAPGFRVAPHSRFKPRRGEIQEPRATPWEAGPYPSSPNRGEMVLAITNRVTRYARHAFRKHDVKCDDDISSSDSGLEDVISPHSGLDHKCARFPGRCPGLFYVTPSGVKRCPACADFSCAWKLSEPQSPGNDRTGRVHPVECDRCLR